jgi:hypothetical protein
LNEPRSKDAACPVSSLGLSKQRTARCKMTNEDYSRSESCSVHPNHYGGVGNSTVGFREARCAGDGDDARGCGGGRSRGLLPVVQSCFVRTVGSWFRWGGRAVERC